MIKDNQKMLNRYHVLIDAFLIPIAFLLSYYLRFESFLTRTEFWSTGNNYFFPVSVYARPLIFLVPGYLVCYYLCKLYSTECAKSRRFELWNLIRANMFGLTYYIFILNFFYLISTDNLYWNIGENISRKFIGMFFVVNIMLCFAFRIVFAYVLEYFRQRGINLKHNHEKKA